MQTQKDNTFEIKRLSSDLNYYNNVFKRTEKLISVIFYILSHTDKRQSSEIQLTVLRDKALQTHEASLGTLSLQAHNQHEGLLEFQHVLMAFESTLRVSQATNIIPPGVYAMLYEQLDLIQRYIGNHYTKGSEYTLEEQLPAAKQAAAKSRPTERRQRVRVPAGDISTDAYLVHSQLTDRAERIKTVLEAKPQATVKDIAEVVTDVSEKTIQRELNSLIEKGQVIREGERRWSRYSVSKD